MPRHRWQEKFFNPFGNRTFTRRFDGMMVCVNCGLEAKKSQVRRGGLGPCITLKEQVKRMMQKLKSSKKKEEASKT